MTYVSNADAVAWLFLMKITIQVMCIIAPPFTIWEIWKRTNKKRLKGEK